MLAETCLLVQEWQAHSEQICNMTKISKPPSFITASFDKHFKIWSRNGEELANVRIVGEDSVVKWGFPIDWSEERKKEKERVLTMMQDIEPEAKIDHDALEFEAQEAQAQKDDKPTVRKAIRPKRSLIRPEMAEHKRLAEQGPQQREKPIKNDDDKLVVRQPIQGEIARKNEE